MTVDFFQHNDCIGNEIQKKVLNDAGFELNIFSIFDINWRAEHLYLFFKNDPVYTWFNYSAPSLENKLFDPKCIEAKDAIEFMLKDKILIKRPLIHFNGEYCAGFETELVKRMFDFSKKVSSDIIRKGGFCANYKSWKQV
jgi:nitrogenase-associated protein